MCRGGGQHLFSTGSATHGALLQFSLQGPPMHAQGAGRGGDIAFVLGQHPLDVLPLQAIHRHGVFRHQGVEVGVLGQQRRQYIIGVRRFAQVLSLIHI